MRAPLTALDTQWSVLPANGIKVAPHPVIAPNGSPVAEEPSFVFLDDSTIYCTFRTICGRLAEAVSVDAGVNFTSGWAEEANGRTIYHPRAKAVVHDLEDGRFLLWHHNNSEKDFTGRNVAWYRLGSRTGNRILWGAPKALAFADDLQAGVSYPAFLNDGTDLIITATDKKTARCWRVAKADL